MGWVWLVSLTLPQPAGRSAGGCLTWDGLSWGDCVLLPVICHPPATRTRSQERMEAQALLRTRLSTGTPLLLPLAKESQRPAQVQDRGNRTFSTEGVKKSLCKGPGCEKGVENWGHFCHQPTTSTILDIFPLRKKVGNTSAYDMVLLIGEITQVFQNVCAL